MQPNWKNRNLELKEIKGKEQSSITGKNNPLTKDPVTCGNRRYTWADDNLSTWNLNNKSDGYMKSKTFQWKKQQTCIVGKDNLHKEVNSHQTSSGNPHLINSSSKILKNWNKL